MDQARIGIGQAACDPSAGIHFFPEDEADEGGQQVRGPHREPEGEDVLDGDADGAAFELYGEDGAAQGQQRVEEPDVVE